ncbi:hypothetical protein F5878DRAFT_609021 [Lentinula raphanica]|uniref:Uncharacterized protein n=1 Tax=Lentinula raphanica TaxID=153919 RepID=A0AA38PFG6_9AGAR|nr:hypothetical protein F5878DRAFT_609021 [Lentinula raphanica]
MEVFGALEFSWSNPPSSTSCQALSLDILVIIRFFQTRAMLKLSTTSVFVVTASLSVIVGAFPITTNHLQERDSFSPIQARQFQSAYPTGPPDSFGGGMSPGSEFSEPSAFGSSPDETNGANVPAGRAGQIAEFAKASAGAARAATQALVVTNTLPTVEKAWHEGVQETKEKYRQVKDKVVGEEKKLVNEKNKLKNKLPFHHKHSDSKHQPPTPAMTPSVNDNECKIYLSLFEDIAHDDSFWFSLVTERSLHDSDDQVPDVSSYL